MRYDLVLGLGWPPAVVGALTLDDLEGLQRAARRRAARASKGRR